MTGPVKRTACILAGFGFVVLVPEVYHELLPIGTVLTYTPEDSAKGNACKKEKLLAHYDDDFKCAVDFLLAYPFCSGHVGAAGMCLGGGLAFRAAIVDPRIKACVCWYPTDLHTGGLSSGDDSLVRCREIKARMLMLFGTADPHIPTAGRRAIYDAMLAAELKFQWHGESGRTCWLAPLACALSAPSPLVVLTVFFSPSPPAHTHAPRVFGRSRIP